MTVEYLVVVGDLEALEVPVAAGALVIGEDLVTRGQKLSKIEWLSRI